MYCGTPTRNIGRTGMTQQISAVAARASQYFLRCMLEVYCSEVAAIVHQQCRGLKECISEGI